MKRILKNCFFVLAGTLALFSCSSSDSGGDEQASDVKILSFSVIDQRSVEHALTINEANSTISNRQPLPAYVNLTQLVATFKPNNYNVSVKVNDEEQNSGIGRYDFSTERVYDLYWNGEKRRSYTVTLTKPELLNNFLTFTFPENQMAPYQPTINLETGIITYDGQIPSNVNISALKPVFTTTGDNTVVRVGSEVQRSGISVQNFTLPVVYTIEGEDGTSKEFTVRLVQGTEAYLTNPIIAGSYADPTVIRVGNMFYLYVTSARVRGYKSSDMLSWDKIGSASEVFTSQPTFTGLSGSGVGMWAPDINYFDGKYVMYYAISGWGTVNENGIGIGVSNNPQGPFVPPAGNTNGKLFLSSEIGVTNSIDPCFFEEDGKRYLFWGSFYGLYMTELTADGMKVKDVTQKTKVAGKSFEAPYVHKRGNYYYLFASIGSCCDGMTSTYKVVVGRSTRLEGPYTAKNGADMKSFDAWNPSNYTPVIMKGSEMFGGPGHNSRIITDDNGVDWMFYHAYVNGSDSRQLMLDKVEWDAYGWPTLGYGIPSYTMTVAPVFR
ncbi:MAG: family 43 glycosylhydrolase [Prevotella sp.]|jgi:arabinan endo-1,5-alpha-L-arabinosidase|nr:family 43 glycosylhydrolase [Prevotella sp.]